MVYFGVDVPRAAAFGAVRNRTDTRSRPAPSTISASAPPASGALDLLPVAGNWTGGNCCTWAGVVVVVVVGLVVVGGGGACAATALDKHDGS